MASPSVSMTDLAEAFISHLLDNKYVGPGVPSTVGITEKNVKNIFNMVRLRVQDDIKCNI